jgi:ABC-type antimicrobial peptide transport system permease subunit
MKILRYFTNALYSLWRNKLRSALSTLGIVIGIASVSIMMSIGEGMRQMMLENLSVSNDVISIVQKMDAGASSDGPKKEPIAYVQVKDIFTEDTIAAIFKHVGNISSVIGYGNGNSPGAQFE